MKTLVKGEGKQEGDIEEKLKHHCKQQSRCTEGYRASTPMKSLPYPYNGWDTKTNLDGVEDKRCHIEHAYLRNGYMCLGITERKAGVEREKSRRNRQMIEQEKNKWQKTQGHPTNERVCASERPRRAICPFCSACHIQGRRWCVPFEYPMRSWSFLLHSILLQLVNTNAGSHILR